MKHLKLPSSLSALLITGLVVASVQADVLDLDGVGDYVSFPGAGIPSGSASFTIEAWINPTTIPAGGENGGQMTFWGNETGNQANGFRLRGSGGLRHFFWGNDHDENLGTNILPDNTGPTTNGWHHFALTWNGTQTRWYWNGVAIGNPRTAAGVNVQAVNHRIGARPGGEFFHGYMDEVRVWSVARSASEIAAEFQRELNGDESGLVAYWNFEGNLMDRAGTNNNGTAVGNAVVTAGLNAPVLPIGPRVYSFAASPSQILLAQSTALSWAVSNAVSVVIDQGIGAVALSNSIVVSPTTTTTYTLIATNPTGSRTVRTTVTVDPGIPTASNFSTNTAFNTPVAITLRGSDPQGSNLTYAIVTPPPHGNLGGTPPNVTYTPANGFGGFDTFTFRVNDGMFDSAPATVSINVVPPPLPPSGISLSTTNIPSSAGPGAFVASLQAVDINNLFGDTQTFGLVAGYGDNAQFSVNGGSLLAGATFAGGPGAVFHVRLRATDSTSLSYTQDFTLGVFDAPRSVVINEIHYNPSFNPIHESFIELYNDTDATVDLSQWRVRGGVDFFFPPNTFLAPHTFVLVAEDPATLQACYGKAAFGPWSGGLNNDGEQLTLRDANSALIDVVDYRNEFPWPVAPDGNGPSAQLLNPSLDNDLGGSWRSALPTPGATNSVFATNAAPHLRQVNHSPTSPRSTNQVTVTCKVTDPNGVASVTLAYQVVAAGSFIPATLPLTTAQLNNFNNVPMTNALNPAFELPANWTTLPMHDDGANGDAVAGDGIYSVFLPQQAHRTLVRYRITCVDLLGASRRAPFEDDPSLNFAYFVYDDLPDYLGFPAASLQTLPIYTLITRDADMTQCTAWTTTPPGDQLVQNVGAARNNGGLHFNWEAAFAYDGKVFDHVTYRLRGANGRYHPGKRSFRIKFKDGALFQAVDNNGKEFPTKWREIVTGKGQSNRGGEQFALNEVVNMFLWNKVGVPAPRTLYFHFRVIRGAAETNQYSGDFWGLNWAQEKYDVNFLEAHDMPKGNLYKLVDNLSPSLEEQRYQGPFAVTNGADLFNVENNLDGMKSTEWLNAHANYTNWYRYFTIAKAIRHYDTWPSANKNGAYYFEPLYGASNSFLGRMIQLPYDSTDTWGATWNNGDDLLYNGIFASGATGGDSGQNPEMQKEYRNVVREIRALLFQPDQINAIIDAHAVPITAVAAADYQRWRNAPAPASYGSLLIPSSPGVTGGLPAYQQDMKNFMFVGGNNAWWIDGNNIGAGGWVTILDSQAADATIPNRPTITYIGTNGFPADGLVFQSSDFADPQGAGTFAAIQWRIAEVLAPGTVPSHPSQLRLEWDAAWDSGPLPFFNAFIAVPGQVVQPDLLYRVRVRHQDNTGRWSQWSLPVEFRPGPADLFSALRTNLVFNELMYNPPGEGALDGDEFEFVELKNIGSILLNLTGLSFSQGIDFNFANGTTLAPGAKFLLARNPAVLASRYPGVVINAVYTGKLDNDGETIAISHPVAGEIISISFGDRAPWPVPADGFGFSLVRNAASGEYGASATPLGTPGEEGDPTALGGVIINEVLSSSTLPLRDSIELLNTATSNVDISGWYLSDDPTFPWKFHIPAGPPLLPGAFRLYSEDNFNPTPGLGTSFSLSSFGDDIYLFSANAGGELTGYSHGFTFGAAQDGVSLGRHINSVGDEQFPLQLSVSPGSSNAGPRVGPIVLSEIHYHPRASSDEFIEVRNITGAAVPLYDPAYPTNRWRLNGAGFIFPPGVTLPANGTALLVADNPTAFRARFGVPAAVPIFPLGGTLQDSGENLELQAPDIPAGTNGVPYFAVDAVRYNDRKPWPLAADGAGASLQRLNLAAYGNDPVNWFAALPSPGTHILAGGSPVVAMQPGSRTNATTTSAFFEVSVIGTGPLFYQWRFNGGNLEGATNSTLIINNVQLTNAGAYQAVAYNATGSTDSSNAMLTVRIGPSITANPTNVTLRVPPDPLASPTNRATFTIGAITYNPPLGYQWRFNGVDLPGQTNVTLTFTNVQLANDGFYTAVVTDQVGPVISQPARLIGLVTPTIVQAPLSQTVPAGSRLNVSVSITGNPPPFGFQWRSNSLIFPLSVSSSGTNFFSARTATNAATATYRVVVTNAASQGNGVSATFTVTTVPDTDQDGLSDALETSLGLNPNDPADAAGDLDLDGMSNADEVFAGTDPNDINNYLRIDQITMPGTATVQLAAVSNRTYSIEYTEALTSGTWRKLADVLGRGTNHIELIPDLNWTTNRFYRAVTPRQQ